MKYLFTSILITLCIISYCQVPEIKISIGHSNPIEDICYSSDEKLIASVTFTEIKIWETQSRKEVKTIRFDNIGFPRKILFTPDSKKIIIGKSAIEGITLVDVKSGNIENIKVAKNWAFGFVDMAISPDGEYLAVSTNESLQLLKLPEFKLIKSVSIQNIVKGLTFNKSSNEIFIGVAEGLLAKYNISDAKLVLEKFPNSVRPHRVAFSLELNKLLCANSDYSFDLWDINNKKLLKTVLKPEFAFPIVDINNVNGNLLIGGTKDMMVRLYNSSSEDPILLGPHNSEVQLTKFSPSGKYIITTTSSWLNKAQRHGLKLWDAADGKPIGEFGNGFYQSNILLVTEGKVVSEQNDNIVIYNLKSGYLSSHKVPEKHVDVLALSGDSIFSLNLVSPSKYSIRDVLRNKEIINFDLEVNPLMRTEFWISKDGKIAVVAGLKFYQPGKSDETVKIFDLETKVLKYEFVNRSTNFVVDAHILNSNQTVCLVSNVGDNGIIRTLDLKSNKIINSFKISSWSNNTLLNDNSILSLSYKSSAKLNLKNGSKEKITFPMDSFKREKYSGIFGLAFKPTRIIPSTNRLLMGYGSQIKIVNLDSGVIEATLPISKEVEEIYLLNNDTIVAAVTDDGTIKYWNLKQHKEIAEVINYSDKDWFVKTPDGLFDGSVGAMENLYFVNGSDIIEFSQLKERYYEPGLLKKILEGNALRSTLGFKSIDLPPDIRVGQIDDKGYFPVELINRGGGIGEVAIYIQGKEVIKDARDAGANPDAPSIKINYYIGGHKNLSKGENYIGVKAWNKEHWIQSRSSIIIYNNERKEDYTSSVHILTCGVSDYAGGSDIDLTYAAKDAEDVNKALKLGASKLFGTQKTFVYNLTTSQPKEFWPTKANILSTFKKISATAHPSDVIIVYLAGHGINVGGTEGDWHYLTQEAFTANVTAYADPSIREQATISSNELVELFKTIPASKQVLIIDACASGKIVDNLIAKRDIPSSTLRALDRMKDRTGMQIITGCTADAVSYEASRYGQGVLTYSLLEGIRGAALRDDEFVDVNKLFNYAQDRVPVLASGIGGIQKPMIFSPNGSQSFDIGQLTEIEKKEIPISKIHPVYIQSNFQDEDEMSDILSLGKKVDQLLSESASRGKDASLIFVPVREYPDGCQLIGRYKRENGKITLKLKKKCESKDVIIDIVGADINDLSNQIVKVTN